VFTARYGLIPYIKQIAFSLKKVKITRKQKKTYNITFRLILSTIVAVEKQ